MKPPLALRPAWVEALLYKIRYQLTAGFSAPPLHAAINRRVPISPLRTPRCIGCGRVGNIFCTYCRQLNDLMVKRMRKLRSTIENKFALR